MRYIALRKLTYVGQDGATYAVLPGEAVPGFESWSSAVKHAHLITKMVEDRHSLNPAIIDGQMRMTVYGKISDGPKGPDAALEQPKTEAAPQKLHLCPHCDHPGFGIKNSLQKHIDRKH